MKTNLANTRRISIRDLRSVGGMIALLLVPLTSFANDSQNAEPDTNGVYKVPVSEELEPFASFPTRLNNQDNFSDTRRFTFELPKELVGRTTKITIGQQEDGTWSGPQAEGTCGKDETNFSCQLRFKNLDIDLNEAAREILKNEEDLAIALKRIQVAEKFSTEPIGILTYSIPRSPKN